MAEDHKAPEFGQLYRARTIDRERQKIAKERAAQRIRSEIVQNAIKGVLRRMSAGAA